MLFLHLLPSPFPCALLLTPNPQEEYGERQRRGPDREVGRRVPSSSPSWPGGSLAAGRKQRAAGDRQGHQGGGRGGLTAHSGDPRRCLPLGVQLDPLSDFPPQEAAPLARGPWMPGSVLAPHHRHLFLCPFPFLSLSLSPTLIFLFLCLFLSSPSLLVSSFPFFLFLSCPLKSPPPCENNASSLPKSCREKKKKLARCSLWVGTFKCASSWPSHL